MPTWCCTLYADKAMRTPMLVFQARAWSIEDAQHLLAAELAQVVIMLYSGVMAKVPIEVTSLPPAITPQLQPYSMHGDLVPDAASEH